MGVDILEIRGQYDSDLVGHGPGVLRGCGLCLISAYPAMVGLLSEDLWFTSGDGKVGLWDLEDLGVVQFAIISAMAVCLEPGHLSGLESPRRFDEGRPTVKVGSPVYSILTSPQRQLPVGILRCVRVKCLCIQRYDYWTGTHQVLYMIYTSSHRPLPVIEEADLSGRIGGLYSQQLDVHVYLYHPKH